MIEIRSATGSKKYKDIRESRMLKSCTKLFTVVRILFPGHSKDFRFLDMRSGETAISAIELHCKEEEAARES